ncbi:MAG: SulP family inorganic anion transporter [Planctomycetales bacterium]|nr:SulP family inorganic anion transporter [Planctomycetales bacterium]
MASHAPRLNNEEVPRGTISGFFKYFASDIVSGLLVFLIALPLCLGISLASGYPPLAGIFTAIIGSILTTFLSNSEMTIKGPAAGLIVIVLGCVQDFGGDGANIGGWSDADATAYRAALAVGCAAAVVQILFGIFRGGILGDFFPSSAVHGMLAAIGVIIILKQFPVALGVTAKGEPLELLREMPHLIAEANPAIASIGVVSLLIMFLWPLVGKQISFLKKIPSPLIVLLVSIPMGMYYHLVTNHSYSFAGHEYKLGEIFLVSMPDRIFGMFDYVTTPDFTALSQPKAWWWVFLFFAIGSLESMLSAKAVDLLDPYRRRCNLDRDVLAVGAANLLASAVGGLPMISEIVRSRANIDNGAKTRFADFWHGIFLLLCVGLIPTVLHRIPLAALAAMLVYTGFRLAHPREFVNVYKIGREQLAIFVVTLVAVLATDLLIGILIGIGVKMLFHINNGVPLQALFKPFLEIEPMGNNQCLIRAHRSAVFSNWIPFRRQLESVGLVQKQNVTLDLSDTNLVDHSVMEKLHEMQEVFASEGLELRIIGLEGHIAKADHEMAARMGGLVRMRRLTVLAELALEQRIESICFAQPLVSYAAQQCRGRNVLGTRLGGEGANHEPTDYVRIEVVGPSRVCDTIVQQLRQECKQSDEYTVYTEAIHQMCRA